MKVDYQRIGAFIIILFGVAVGWHHLKQALAVISMFKNNEPILSWVCIVSGPLSTLPAMVVALLKKRIGSYWLFAGSAVSLVAFIALTRTLIVTPFLLRITLPMIVLGYALLVSERKTGKPIASALVKN